MSVLTDNLLNLCNSFRSCAVSGSPCVFVIVNRCATGLERGMPLKHLCTTQALVPESLLYHCEVLRTTFPTIGTKFDTHSLFFFLIHHENRHESPTKLQKRGGKLPTSTQLRASWHNYSLTMVVIRALRATTTEV
jgi:hypothetical protein